MHEKKNSFWASAGVKHLYQKVLLTFFSFDQTTTMKIPGNKVIGHNTFNISDTQAVDCVQMHNFL